MRSTWLLARNWLAGRPGRTALMVAAVAIAASLVVAVSCSIASVQASLEFGIVRILGATDARIIHPANGRFDQALLETVRSWPEVELATGRLGGSLTLVHADRRKDAKTGELIRSTPSALGVDFLLEPRFRTQKLTAGRWPSGPREVLLDPIAADELQAKPGDKLHVQRFGTPVELTVAGVFERQVLGTLQRPFVDLDRSTLAEVANLRDQLTSIVILLRPDIDPAAFCAKHAGHLPQALVLEPAEKARSGFDRQVLASRFGFTIAAVLTFVCASFIIVTAMTTSVTQRQRDMAVIRCLGGTRTQLFTSQLLVGLTMGVAGATAGVPLGIGLTWALVAWFSEQLPAGVRLEPLGLWLAASGSVLAGVLGALHPAWTASRVTPLLAMTARSRPARRGSLIVCALIGLLLVMVQLALLQLPDASRRFFAYAYVGLPALLVGYFLLSAPITVLIAQTLAGPCTRLLRLPGGMLRSSVMATPFRHGFTAGAMMVGMAILVSTWSTATSLLNDWLGRIKFADGFAFRAAGIGVEAQQAIAGLPFVEAVCTVVYFPLQVADRQIFGVRGLAPSSIVCMGFEPEEFFRLNAVEWAAGNPQEAVAGLRDGTGLIVADRFLTTQQVSLGDTLTLQAGQMRKTYVIVGAVSSAGLDIATQMFGIRNQYMEFSISCVFLDRAEVVRTFNNTDAHLMQIDYPDEMTDEEVSRRIAEAAPGVQFKSGRGILKTIDQIALAMLGVQSTIAFAALALSSFAVGNVILANIQGRQYEYGVLRSIGSPRALLGRVILAEAMIIAIAAAATGAALGLHLAWVGATHYRDLAGLPVVLRVPAWPMAAGALSLLAFACVAAAPAIRSIIKPPPAALLAPGRDA